MRNVAPLPRAIPSAAVALPAPVAALSSAGSPVLASRRAELLPAFPAGKSAVFQPARSTFSWPAAAPWPAVLPRTFISTRSRGSAASRPSPRDRPE